MNAEAWSVKHFSKTVMMTVKEWNQKQIFFTFPRQFLTNQGPPPGPWICYSEQWRKQNTITECDICTNLLNCICGYSEKCTDTSVVCEAKRGSWWGTTEHGGCLGPRCCLSSSATPPSSSVGDSSIEVEVSHVFGRFLRSAHLLIVEDDPPAGKKGF